MNEKNHEVELRALLAEDQFKKISDELKKHGASLKGEDKLTDIYYCLKKVKTFAEIEMDEVGSYSLRLRKTEKDGEQKTDLNIKVITNFGDHHAWDEHEITIDSFEEMDKIITSIGFKPFVMIEKVRRSYDLEDMSINLEDIKDFGLAIEIEIMTQKEKSEEAKNKIRGFLKKIGIDEDKIVPKSVTNIIMKQKAVF